MATIAQRKLKADRTRALLDRSVKELLKSSSDPSYPLDITLDGLFEDIEAEEATVERLEATVERLQGTAAVSGGQEYSAVYMFREADTQLFTCTILVISVAKV
jgi:hypothetical protein